MSQSNWHGDTRLGHVPRLTDKLRGEPGQAEELERLRRALKFYADERNYSALNAPGVELWEPDHENPDRWWGKPVGWRDDLGDIARRALTGRNFYTPTPGEPPPMWEPQDA